MSQRDGDVLRCSFCGKSQHEVRKLIAGPSVYICDECVELCNDIIREELEDAGVADRDGPLEELPSHLEGSSRLEPNALRWIGESRCGAQHRQEDAVFLRHHRQQSE